MGTLLRSFVEVRKVIELSYGMISGVGPGIDVLGGVDLLQGEWAVSWGFSRHWFQWVSVAYLLNRNVFDLCMKS